MMPDKTTLAALLAVTVLAGAAGWTANGWRYEAQLSDLKSNYATATEKAASAHAKALAEANERGNHLVIEQAAMENTFNETLREKNNEIARLTTGRRCLDARVVGMLNRDDGAASNGRSAPQAAGVVVRADGTAAAGADDGQETAGNDGADAGEESFASDADVAGWIALCRTRYDICRADRDRLRRFYDAASLGGRSDE